MKRFHPLGLGGLLALLGFFCAPALAQLETAHWLLTNQDQLDFQTDPPQLTPFPGAVALHFRNSFASVSDAEGNLLFYSDGYHVYDRGGTIMPNGADLHLNSVSAVMIVPRPQHPGLYYVFVSITTGVNLETALDYTLVDMRANEGKGDVVQRPARLRGYGTSYITATAGCAEDTVWVMGSTRLESYAVTEAGVDTLPVSSNETMAALGLTYWSFRRLSPTADRLVFANAPGSFFLADFDLATGKVMRPRQLFYSDIRNIPTSPAAEFSPSGNLLYLSIDRQIFQFDIRAGSEAAIRASQTLVWEAPEPLSNPIQLQLGADGRIYFRWLPLDLQQYSLGVISLPEQKGRACAPDAQTYMFPMPNSFFGLPLFPSYLLARPQWSLAGSQTVCPRIEGVRYWVQEGNADLYTWTVEGGTIVSGQGTDTITVNWGPTHPAASVLVAGVSRYGCFAEGVLPVKIKVRLEPPVPQGPTLLCANRVDGQAYHVLPTTGSVYTWEAVGGTVVSGQGSSHITVDWQGTGEHLLWVQEQSTTIDTVCAGLSDTVRVRVVDDPTTLSLRYASFDTIQTDVVHVVWSTNRPDLLQSPALETSRAGAVRVTPYGQGDLFIDTPSLQEDLPRYRIRGFNTCGDTVFSLFHRPVFLTGTNDTTNQLITLTWTAYEGWPVDHYEIWQRVEQSAGWRKIDAVAGSLATPLTYTAPRGQDGFFHQYMIRAVGTDNLGPVAAWSNPVYLNFPHPLLIPNVFSPNHKGPNETFTVKNLEFYPQARLVVYNRWGKQVYAQTPYRNDWQGLTNQGNPLAAGTYYYFLDVLSEFYIPACDVLPCNYALRSNYRQTFRGWVQIVR
ncbi:gliding motility-associated C-terminal domain-containing protein [Catalinimonas alkaloidigena]|uniref:Gliding motility-associated C-terminal domain-containing protein n=1 Tax=Catalinimonas alkaloidigena TaxID=1075417 RepID=A0A1G8YFK5_9BACT|nr:gliding motility-associated C-terminal domain-containing protein [Catalinimonas alkaloidigena]SDK01618.1 gliding motility-associated C-terminal domain-containing protein [Catalinimonas alkaloidigena]